MHGYGASMESTPRALLSKETRDLFIWASKLILDDWVKFDLLRQLLGIKELSEALEQVYIKVDWSDRDSILPLVPILEQLYRHTPKTMINVPQRIDQALAKDGFQMKQGKLVRLKSGGQGVSSG